MSGDIALEVDGLSVAVETPSGDLPVVREASFAVRSGETLAVLGESGCGKSMTAQAIAGLLDPVARVTGGTVRLALPERGDTDLLTLSGTERRRLAGTELAIVFQDALTALNPVQTVGAQLGEPFRIHQGMSRRASKRKAIELMERVGIPDARARVDAYPHQFSGGMRQRLLIAIAVALEPAVLIADEPTTALDVTVQAQIMELLRELRAERRMGLVLITHDLAVVAEQADDVAVMYAGRVVETGPVTEVFGRPRHPYTRGLLDSMPGDVARGAELRSIPGGPPPVHDVPSGCAFRTRCPLVRERCSEERPVPAEVGAGHRSACHFWKELADG